MNLSTAQAQDQQAGNLTALGATGGPTALSGQNFYIGINDPVGLDPNNPVPLSFDPKVFHTFDSWKIGNPYQQPIARGQEISTRRPSPLAASPD